MEGGRGEKGEGEGRWSVGRARRGRGPSAECHSLHSLGPDLTHLKRFYSASVEVLEDGFLVVMWGGGKYGQALACGEGG